ncbi:hypothetical protein NDU88_003283 [Pleurodeles waltl]|uniref:Uncharacterized protein n=1 Tax=Pleurodeles waltl TaxID=8319 RepID=A0AAV7SFB8_PLEWA|nr:hypothetical protein NDU88_003283 [Pleurodeles waltl]
MANNIGALQYAGRTEGDRSSKVASVNCIAQEGKHCWQTPWYKNMGESTLTPIPYYVTPGRDPPMSRRARRSGSIGVKFRGASVNTRVWTPHSIGEHQAVPAEINPVPTLTMVGTCSQSSESRGYLEPRPEDNNSK